MRQIHIMMTTEEAAKLSRQLKRDQDKAKVAVQLLSEQKLPELTPKRNPET
jgi:hypothetical protein